MAGPADAYTGEVRAFCGDILPAGWLACDGAIISMSDYEDLFSVIGTTYGGNGTDTFAVPDLRDASAMSSGTGPGLSTRPLGERVGAPAKTLGADDLPSHSHTIYALNETAETTTPGQTVMPAKATKTSGPPINRPRKLYDTAVPTVELNHESVGMTGTVTPVVNNHQPSLGLTYMICYSGTYPSTS